jgi:cystathionine beta-lyase
LPARTDPLARSREWAISWLAETTLMIDDFDQPIDRRSSDSVKWNRYGEDVLPLWVADLDFRSPPAVLRALSARVEHGVFGYGSDPKELAEILAARLASRYGWQVAPHEIVFLPGVVPALALACRAFAEPGDGVLVQSPVYGPILDAPRDAGRVREDAPFVRGDDGRYGIDWDALEAGIGPRTRLFVLCNPQNPLGRVLTREELVRIASLCDKKGLIICSDEIHCDLVFPGHEHVPIASLSPEVAARTVTLMAPSKTYNLAGLGCAFAVVQSADLRARLRSARSGLVPYVNVLGFAAAIAAYREGQSWLDEALAYLATNRDTLVSYVRSELHGVSVALPEGTYLAWLDCRASAAGGDPYRFFLDRARVALSDGTAFGAAGAGFVRLNFGCRRALLATALECMKTALEG